MLQEDKKILNIPEDVFEEADKNYEEALEADAILAEAIEEDIINEARDLYPVDDYDDRYEDIITEMEEAEQELEDDIIDSLLSDLD